MVCQPDKRGQKAELERSHHQSDLMINLIWWSIWSDVQKNHLKLFLSPSSFTSQPLLANPAWLGFGRIVIVVRSPYYACVNWICISYSCFRFAMFTLSRHCIFFLYFDLCFCIIFLLLFFHISIGLCCTMGVHRPDTDLMRCSLGFSLHHHH